MNKKPPPASLLSILLSLSFSSRKYTVLAFAHHNTIIHHRPLIYGQQSQPYIMSPSLRTRGGGPPAATIRPSSNNQDDNEKSQKISAQQALKSINYCVKMCFFSVISNIIITFIDNESSASNLGLMKYTSIFDSLSLLFFGAGLWRISKLYYESFSNMNTCMNHDSSMKLFTNMSWIWGATALNIALVSISMAISLPMHCVSGGYFQSMLENISSKQLLLGILSILGVGSIVIYKACVTTADREYRAYKEKNDIHIARNMERRLTERWSNREQLGLVHEAVFFAYCTQALCCGSFALMASLQLIQWIISFNVEGVVGHLFSVTEFITPFTITVLLYALNKALIKAAIAEVVGDTKRVKDVDIYNDLFVAQSGFYSQAASTIRDAAVFGLLPYIARPLLLPYVFKLTKVVKLLEKLLPAALYAQVVEIAGGVKM